MPLKITNTQIRPSTDIDWMLPTILFGSEYEVLTYRNNPDLLEMNVEISDDGLTRKNIILVKDDWDECNGIIDSEFINQFRKLIKEYCLKNNIIISQTEEHID